jgi:CDP-glucose 4,6-dehydratase
MAKVMFGDAYRGKRVFVTGHTGFKGSWLCLWLEQLGAEVTGYALHAPTEPNLFGQAHVVLGIEHHLGDVRDAAALEATLAAARPDFVFHLAAQPLVLGSYEDPAGTFATNVTGSINLLEALRAAGSAASVVMVTTDKVYRNPESGHAFAEDDPLGGHDPYSASKAAMEIAIASWRDSFFARGPARIASARAGNVIGGGDWAANRLVPDLVRSRERGEAARLRNPGSLRPWQHVLEPLAGYLWLGARLAGEGGVGLAEAWNFGPEPDQIRTVGNLATALLERWGQPGWSDGSIAEAPHEAGLLRLAIGKARERLGWHPVWDFDTTVARTADWYAAVRADPASARTACLADLEAYCAGAAARDVRWVR